jgi:hypothetical protein
VCGGSRECPLYCRFGLRRPPTGADSWGGALKLLYLNGNPQLSGQAALRLHLREHNPICDMQLLLLAARAQALLCPDT